MTRTYYCTRCQSEYQSIGRNVGVIELSGGNPDVKGRLCEECYGDMVAAFRDGGDA